MTGLEKEIEIRKNSKLLNNTAPLTYSFLCKVINKPYNTVRRKVANNSFTVGEALKIFNTVFNAKTKFDAFEYLFSEIEGE